MCSIPNGPVNPVDSCIFVAVLYFPVFFCVLYFPLFLFFTTLLRMFGRPSGVLLQEAEGKLSDAIKAGNMDQISVAHAIEIARKRMSEATNELSTLAAKRKRCVDKRKRHVDSTFLVWCQSI